MPQPPGSIASNLLARGHLEAFPGEEHVGGQGKFVARPAPQLRQRHGGATQFGGEAGAQDLLGPELVVAQGCRLGQQLVPGRSAEKSQIL